MDEAFARTAGFLDRFWELHDMAAAQIGISPLFVITGVLGALVFLNALRDMPTRRRIHAQVQASQADGLAAAQDAQSLPEWLEHQEERQGTPADPGSAGLASRAGPILIGLAGLGVIGGAAYFMHVGPESAPGWRASIYLFGSLVALLGLC